MAASIETRNLMGSALALVLVGIAFAAVLRFMRQTQASAESRAKVNVALQSLERGLSQLKDAETGQRGFLLTGSPGYLVSYETGRRQVVDTLGAFAGLDGARQLPPQDLAALHSLTAAKLDEMAQTIQLFRAGRREDALNLVKEGSGLQTMDQLRALHGELAAALTTRRDLDEAAARNSRLLAQRALFLLGGLGLLGIALSAFAMQRDIRLRTASERALARSEAKFRTLAESAPVGIYELSSARDEVYANGEHFRLTGVPREEARRERFQASVHPEDAAGVLAQVAADMREGRIFDLAYRLRHPDGTVLWVQSRGVPIEATSAHEASYLIVTQDITAMRAAEAEILAKAEALEAANKELEAFAYSVSHDLRAPLRHIDGFVGLLRRSLGAEVDPRSAHHLDVISAAARQMGALIDDLLSFSRMGRTEVHKTTFDLGTMVRRVIDELAPDRAGREVEWRIGELPQVHGDPSLLHLVLLNLLGNALKFTRTRAQARVEISARLEEHTLVITIRDNGAGFDMRFADKLFGVFQRLHRQDEFEGTGIGLANVARIIQKHGGTVSALGAVDEGASFSFTLPALEAS